MNEEIFSDLDIAESLLESADFFLNCSRENTTREYLSSESVYSKTIGTYHATLAVGYIIRAMSTYFHDPINPEGGDTIAQLDQLNLILSKQGTPPILIANSHLIQVGIDYREGKSEDNDIKEEELRDYIASVQQELRNVRELVKSRNLSSKA